MGDRSPKAKSKAKKQSDLVKAHRRDAADAKAHPAEGSSASGKKGR